MLKLKQNFILALLFVSTSASAQLWNAIGPVGGYFKDFAIHPANNQIVFAGSDDSGGIWKSTDGGNSWELVTEEIPDMTGWHIEIDASNPNIIYGCDAYGRYGVIKSTDGGNNWSVINSGLNSKYDKMVTKLAINPSDNQNLFISTGMDSTGTPPRPGNGVFKSTNGGALWVPSGLQDTTVTCITMTASGKLFAGTDHHGLWYSLNLGATWNQVAGIPADAMIHQVEAQDDFIAVGADVNGIFQSTNDGSTFTNIGLVGEFNFDISIGSLFGENYIYSTSTTSLMRYMSILDMWLEVADLPDNYLGIGITARGNDIYYAVFANTEFWHSSDGGTSFTVAENAPKCTEISSITVDPNNSDHFFATLLGTYSSFYNKECLYETTNGGDTWTRKGPTAHALCARFAPGSSDVVYCGTFSQGLFKSTNNFNSYSNIRQGNLLISDISIDVQDTSKVFIGEINLDDFTYGVYRSENGGGSFELILPQLVSMIYNSPNSDSLFVASENGLYISPDNGDSWSNLLSGFSLTSITIHNGDVYVGLITGQVIRAYPTYEDLTGDWGIAVAKNLVFHNDTLYLGLSGAEQDTSYSLSGGIWLSPDFGATWTDFNGNLSNSHCYGNPGLVFAGDNLLMGTYSNGIMSHSMLPIGIPSQTTESISGISVYPNPASDFIQLALPDGFKNDKLIIYNSNGAVVKSISNVNGPQYFLDVNGLPNGEYLVRLFGRKRQFVGRFVVEK